MGLCKETNSSDNHRSNSGTAHGKGYNIKDKWLKGSDGNVGLIPNEIADKLRGKEFSSFDKFRSEFWKEIVANPKYATQFNKNNNLRMQKGLAPIARESQHNGKHKSYILHHNTPIQHSGGVFNMDNINIVTPRFHQVILTSSYHY